MRKEIKTNHNKVYSAYPSGYAPYTERYVELEQTKQMKQKDLKILEALLNRTEELPDILGLRAPEIGYELTENDKSLLLNTYEELDNILKEVAAFINVKFKGRKDFISAWNEIDFDTKIGGIKVVTTDRQHIKQEWKNGLFDLKSLIRSLINEVTLLIDDDNQEKNSS